MTETLGYARIGPRKQSKAIAILASALLLYPLLVLASLSGEWLLARLALGHPPRPSADDPKQIAGSRWLHGITALAVLGILPAGGSGACLDRDPRCGQSSLARTIRAAFGCVGSALDGPLSPAVPGPAPNPGVVDGLRCAIVPVSAVRTAVRESQVPVFELGLRNGVQGDIVMISPLLGA